MRRKHLGFIYQFHHLLPEFSAVENIAIPQMIGGTAYPKAVARARELLAALGLEARASHRPAELSGGEQQRVAIARAISANPSLILADEPTGNLDQKTSESVFQMFVELARLSRGRWRLSLPTTWNWRSAWIALLRCIMVGFKLAPI